MAHQRRLRVRFASLFRQRLPIHILHGNPTQLGIIAGTDQCSAAIQFICQYLQRQAGTCQAAGRHAIECRAPDQCTIRSQCQRFGNVRPTPQAAVDEDLGLIAYSLPRLLQYLQRMDAGIQLASAMIAQHYAIRTTRQRCARIFRRKNTLDHELAPPACPQIFHITPVQAGIELAGDELGTTPLVTGG